MCHTWKSWSKFRRCGFPYHQMYALHANVKTWSDWRATNLRVTKTFKMKKKREEFFLCREKNGNGEVAPPKGQQLARSGYGLCESGDGLLCRHRVVVVVCARRPMQRKTPWQVEPIKSKQATRSHQHTLASCFSIKHCIFLIALNKNGTRLNSYTLFSFSFSRPFSFHSFFPLIREIQQQELWKTKRKKQRRMVSTV